MYHCSNLKVYGAYIFRSELTVFVHPSVCPSRFEAQVYILCAQLLNCSTNLFETWAWRLVRTWSKMDICFLNFRRILLKTVLHF